MPPETHAVGQASCLSPPLAVAHASCLSPAPAVRQASCLSPTHLPSTPSTPSSLFPNRLVGQASCHPPIHPITHSPRANRRARSSSYSPRRSGGQAGCLTYSQPHTRLFLALWLAIACFLATPARADDAAAIFDQANKLYEQGRYAQAIDAYQQLLEKNQVSAALYFNLGNAHFKNGQTGRAIAHYRLAERLDPRDPDIRANLRFARESVTGSPGTRRWQRWSQSLSINELTLATAAVGWLFFGMLTIGEVRRDWQKPLRRYTILLAGIGLLGGAWLGLVLEQRLGTASAIVIANETAVRYGPFEESKGTHTLRDGVELTILDRKDNWLQVSDAHNRTGWVQSQDVLVLPPG